MPRSQYPVIYAGSDFTAAQVQAFSPFFAWKAAPATITSTSFVNDPDLVVPVVAGASYFLEIVLLYSTATSGAFPTFGVTFPSGTTAENDLLYFNNSGGAGTLTLTDHSGAGVPFGASGGNQAAELKGMALVGSTAGNIQLEYLVASSTTTLLACSWMRVTRVQ